MSIRQIRDLALKILGLYYLSSALVQAPPLASIFLSWDKSPEMAGHGVAIALSGLLPFAFWLGIGLLLTFRTAIIDGVLWPVQEESGVGTTTRPSLRFWIVLIGFFFFISAAGDAVAQLWILAAEREMRAPITYTRFLPDLATLLLSVFCILKAQVVETWLESRIEDSPRP